MSDLDENDFVSLPALHTRPEIPVCEEDIPIQEDVDQWPHLDGVFIPHFDAEIGLLICSDVPEVLDPVEIRHNENGGSYASHWLGSERSFGTLSPWISGSKLPCQS